MRDSGNSIPMAATRLPDWRDRKRYLWLLGLLVPLFPFISWGLTRATGLGIWWYLGPIFVLGIIPVVDLIVGIDRSNPPEAQVRELEQDRYYRVITYVFLPIQYAGLVWSSWMWAHGELSWSDRIGLALTVGVVAGIAINTAHELGHKRNSLEHWFAKIALAQSGYGHFYVEHNRGHHVRVATPEDPASSRVGENVYVFLPRTIIGGYRSAWRLEQPRFKRRNQSHFSIRNDVLNAWLLTLVLWATLLIVFGVEVLPLLLIQAAVGIALLEFVNYIEHYGLLRRREASGRWERVQPIHSWNSNNVATNVLLYHLQRHSDHHANPTRRYQALRDIDSAPALPTGYAGMILLAAIPPLWYRIMDPKVAAHFDGDMSRANIKPSARERILRRRPTSTATERASGGTTSDSRADSS